MELYRLIDFVHSWLQEEEDSAIVLRIVYRSIPTVPFTIFERSNQKIGDFCETLKMSKDVFRWSKVMKPSVVMFTWAADGTWNVRSC